MPDLPIDWANVNWVYVAVLAVFVFIATLVGNLLTFSHRAMAALLSAVLFAAIFVFWTYYPHHLPLPTRLTVEKAAAAAAGPRRRPAASAPVRPRNPVTDITPPSNPVTTIPPPAQPAVGLQMTAGMMFQCHLREPAGERSSQIS